VKSEARYRAVVEDQTDLICRRLPDGTVTFVNEAFARFFGKKPDEFIGKVFPPGDPPEEFSNVEASQVPHVLPVVTGTSEHQILLENGETRWIQWKNRALQDAQGNSAEVQSVGRDMTRQREREKEIAIKECAIAKSPHPYVIWETMGRVVYVNDAFLSIFGYRDEREVVGRFIDRYFPRTGTDNNIMQVISSLTETGRWDGIMEARKGDGTFVSVEARANLMKNDPYLPTGGGIALLSDCVGRIPPEMHESHGCQAVHRGMPHENPGPAPGTPGHSPPSFEEMLDPLPTPTFIIDRERRVIAWNRAIELVSGIGREEILGTSGYARAFSAFQGRIPVLIDMLDLPDDLLAKDYPDVQRVGDSIVTEIFIPSSGGGPDSYILARAGPLCGPDGNLAGFIMGLQDLSDWKNSQISMDRFKGKIDSSLNRLMSQLEERIPCTNQRTN
jgi:PAS domain S-box-containing protein